jgi:pimeloyl-ACP methyl ester carboxylesterase
MRGLRNAAIAIGLALAALYALGLGIYAASSTRPAVASEPRDGAAAAEVIRRLGLEREYPFAHRFFDAPGGRMHWGEAGRGAPVLCVHGNPTWSFLYRNFARGLDGSARVIAPDLIGFGLSEKRAEVDAYTIEGHVEDVSALVEALDLRGITLVVQDWGGPIGLGVAVRHPERFRALVVMNTIGFVPDGLGDGAGPPLALRVLRVPLLGEMLVQGLGLFNRVIVPAVIAKPERKSDLVRRAYVDVQGSWDARAGTLAFPRLIPASPDDPVVGLLREEDAFVRGFEGPVLIAWGMRDPAFPPALLEQWRERLPNARVIELPDAGHFVQEDAWEVVVPEVGALLR